MRVGSATIGSITTSIMHKPKAGYAHGTLAARMGMTAAVPPMDPVPMRTMMAMGMGHMKGMKMGAWQEWTWPE